MSAPDIAPPCSCPECSALRSALAAMEIPESLQHDTGAATTIRVGDREMTTLEARLRLLLADPDANPYAGAQAQALLGKVAGRTALDATQLRDGRRVLARVEQARAVGAGRR